MAWICAVYIEETHRGHAYALRLLERAREDAGKADILMSMSVQTMSAFTSITVMSVLAQAIIPGENPPEFIGPAPKRQKI